MGALSKQQREELTMYDYRSRTIWVLAAVVLLGFTSGISAADEQPTKARDGDVNHPVNAGDQDPKELSVPPLDHVVYPKSRPAWIKDPVQQKNNIATFVVLSGPCETREESLQELKLMRHAALSTFIETVTGSVENTDIYSVSDEKFERDLIQRRYAGKLSVGGTTQYEDAVEIRISEAERNLIQKAWKNIKVTQRMITLGFMTCGGLITLMVSSTVFGAAIRRRESVKHSATASA